MANESECEWFLRFLWKGILNQSNFKNKSKILKMFHMERKNKEIFDDPFKVFCSYLSKSLWFRVCFPGISILILTHKNTYSSSRKAFTFLYSVLCTRVVLGEFSQAQETLNCVLRTFENSPSPLSTKDGRKLNGIRL